MATKADFAVWFKNVPGVSGWFGNAKIDLWSKGAIASAMYDKYFAWYQSSDTNSILADIQRHTGTVYTAPQQSLSEAYQPIVDFLTKQLIWQQTALTDNAKIPLAEAAVYDEINRTTIALNYYKSLQKS